MTQSTIYPYNNTTAAVKTWNTTYITDSNHLSNYVRNLLSTTVLTTGGNNITVLTNTSYPYSDCYYCGSAVALSEMDPSPPVPLQYRGLPLTSVTPSDGASYTLTTWGSVSQVTNSEGTVSVSSDPATNYAAPLTISTQSYSEAVAYAPSLAITQTTGANGEQYATTYDSAGRPSSASSPYGGVVDYSYSTNSQTKSGPDGLTVASLDGLGRATRMQRIGSGVVQSNTDTVYAPCACSPLGKVQQVSQPYAPGSTEYWTTYVYDGIGRTLSVTQPDGASTTAYAYSGNQTTTTDPAANWKQFTTDVEGNLTTAVEPDPANQPGGTLTTSYTYDWMKHVAGVTMTRAGTTQTRTFVYSNAGLLTSATNPENGTVSYYYNADNTLQYKHDAKGQDTVYTYDSQKRLTMTQQYPYGQGNSTLGCSYVVYYWDGNLPTFGGSFSPGPSLNRVSGVAYGTLPTSDTYCVPNVNPLPNLTNFAPAPEYVELFAFDVAGSVATKAFTTQNANSLGSSVSVSYTRDSWGHILTTSYPTGPAGQTGIFTYTYDSMGRPNSLTDNGQVSPYENVVDWVQNAQYDYAGRLATLPFSTNLTSANLTETRSWNVNGQLASLGWGGTTIQYLYSATHNNGQITQTVDLISGETVTYQYDALKRVTSAGSVPTSGSPTPAWTQTFQYDGFGNLTAKVLNGTTTPIAVNAPTNHLANAQYDANGNMVSGAGATLGHDVSNRLAWANAVSGEQETYEYAPDNKRVHRHTSAETDEYTLYGVMGEKLAVYSLQTGTNNGVPFATFTPLRISVWFGKKLIWENGPVLSDRTGNNRAVPLGGTYYSLSQYYPYGDESPVTANDRTKFATYTRDSYTGFDYADQRYYASTYGRFNTPDPYMASAKGANDPTTPGSWNRYAYVQGDPVNANDPRGLFLSEEEDGEGIPEYDNGYWGCPNCAYAGPSAAYYASTIAATGTNGSPSYFLALQRAKAAQFGEAKVKDSQPCDAVLSALGMTFQGLQTAVASEVFMDGTEASSTTMVSLFQNSTLRNQENAVATYGNQTVQYYLTHGGSNSAAVASAGGNLVFLNYNQFGGASNPTNEAILMHEALHNYIEDD